MSREIITASDLRGALLASIEAVLEGRLNVAQANAVVGLSGEPEQKPLTREEISYGFRTNDADLDAKSYWAGVKYAEKAHGIGGGE